MGTAEQELSVTREGAGMILFLPNSRTHEGEEIPVPLPKRRDCFSLVSPFLFPKGWLFTYRMVEFERRIWVYTSQPF